MALFSDINQVVLLGNITKDPELKVLNNGNKVVSFSMATNEQYKSGDEWKKKSTFHNVSYWGDKAETFVKWVKKGTRIHVTGKLNVQSWEGRDGSTKYKTEVLAQDIILIDRYEKPGSQAESSMPDELDDLP